ncbi:hypothetical protein EJ05DRAFT_104834 [Pseudovirgaria hyperparasitica]|uniref:Uncharacterized protein n=1 Tax=Pseudovirgaria hyperparasitica TaxID=470096 RepID=A0A6A6VY30_9PEZI|nr:uncharacterized protein EJ05DRAFT_104834 [Pseudovirgaria hyperparasitica]KAF2755522.1 hypothetical protein EJ05DRAFT_104834 [Pseudovirgaria hyperparasitica]
MPNPSTRRSLSDIFLGSDRAAHSKPPRFLSLSLPLYLSLSLSYSLSLSLAPAYCIFLLRHSNAFSFVNSSAPRNFALFGHNECHLPIHALFVPIPRLL